MYLADTSYPFLSVMWTMIVFFAWVIWIWLLITVYTDLFRRKDIGGGKKTLWVLFTLFVPFIGVLSYLIAQGHKMTDRSAEWMQENKRQTDEYIKSVAASGSSADQIAKAKQLLDSGAITADEYAQMKRKALAAEPASTGGAENYAVRSTR